MKNSELTMLLHKMRQGSDIDQRELLNFVYMELRQLARSKLRREYSERSLSVTELVNEAWIRLTPDQGREIHWENRRHFFSAAAEAMRRILIEQSRRRRALKRCHDGQYATAIDVCEPSTADQLDLCALDEALQQLEAVDVQAATVIKLRFFTGLSLQDLANMLNLSRATIVRELTFARTWLKSRMED